MKNMKRHIIFLLIVSSTLGICAQSGWSPDLPVNPNLFTEEEKAAQRERGSEFLRELNKLVIRPNEDKVITVENDCRFSGSGSFSVSSLKRTKIVGAEGKNVTFWFDAPHVWGMQLNNCAGVTFENLIFDCDPVPFTQGKIISKSGQHSVVLEPMAGYEKLIENPNGTFIVFNPDGSFKLHQHRTCTVVQNANKTITLTGNFDIVEIGDYVALPSRTGNMIGMTGCEKIIFKDVNVYASGGMCCYGNGGKGGHEFQNFKATRRPGTNRLYAFGADGFHMNEMESGPIIENSEMAYTADDLINFHGRFGWVCSRNSDRKDNLRIICTGGAIKVNNEIDFWDNNTQEYRGKAKVLQITAVTDQNAINEARKGAIEYLGGNVYDIRLDTEVEADFASLIEHHVNLCSGFVVRNCKLHDTFNRGFLINGATDGLIENNEIYNVASGQSFHMETWSYGEGQYIKDLTVRNNTFKNAGALWFGLVPAFGNEIYGAYRTSPMKNITVKDNTVELFEGDVCGISVGYTDGVTIEGNRIVRNALDKTQSYTNVNYVDGYGRSLNDAIFVSSCRNVAINNNQVDDLSENMYNDVGYGTLVNTLKINEEQQLNSVADVLSGWLLNGNQNDIGWSYGYADAAVIRNDQYTPDAFILMTKKGSGGWLPEGLYSPAVGKQQTTPGTDRSSVIRWTSTIDGTLSVVGKIADNGSSTGNKVICYFFVDGTKKYEYDTSSGSTNLSVDLGAVSAGSKIDFIVDSKGNTSGDQTFFNYKFLSTAGSGSSVKDPEVNEKYKIYAGNGMLNIDLLSESSARLSVYDMSGISVFRGEIGNRFSQLLNPGIYIIKVNEKVYKFLMP